MKSIRGIPLYFLLAGMVFWLGDAAVDSWFAVGGSYWSNLGPGMKGHEILMRALGTAILVLSGIVFAGLSQRRRGLGQALAQSETHRQEMMKVTRALRIRDRVSQTFLTAPADSVFGKALDTVLELIDSPIGFFGYLDENGNLVCPSLTRSVWGQCDMPDGVNSFPRSVWQRMAFGRAIETKTTICANHTFEVPEGHIPITRMLCTPILHGEEVIGLIAIANRVEDYDDREREDMETIATCVAPILHARLMRQREERERTHVEGALLTEKGFTDAALGSIPGVFFLINCDGQFVRWNKELEHLIGQSTSEVSSLHMLDLFEPQARERVWELMLRTSRENSFVIEERLQSRTREGVPFVLTGKRVVIGEAEYIAGVGLDISERKTLEEALSRARRLELAGRFAGQIAHDFNNLLGPLMAYPGIIRNEVGGNKRIGEMLSDMESAARQIANINQDLLTLGHRGYANMTTVNLNTIVDSVLKTLSIPDGITVRRRSVHDPLPIVAGNAQVTRTLVNLIVNAVEAMKEKGSLVITTRKADLKEPWRGYNLIPAGVYARVDIADSGSGIPNDILQKVFEPFFSTKSADQARGSGLGLSVVHAVTEDHSGHVDVATEIGRGTTFSLYFPYAPVTDEVTYKEPSEDKVPGAAGHSVMVIDDDMAQLRMASTMLASLGYKVITAASGEEAVTRCQRESPDVILLDMVMMELDGAETLRRIKEYNPDQIALIYSGYAANERVEEALRLGAWGFIPKPVEIGDLARAIHGALSERRHQPAYTT